jgi:hypothetical protein
MNQRREPEASVDVGEQAPVGRRLLITQRRDTETSVDADAGVDDGLRRALRGLPPAEPGPHFTAAVLARLDRPLASTRRQLPAWVAAAAVVALLASAWGAVAGRAAIGERRKAELFRESAAIAVELQALREQASRASPVLYLGGTEEVDLVLDLATLPVAAAVRVPGGSADGRPN